MHFDDRMDGSQGIGAIGANNSSDFVSWPFLCLCLSMPTTKLIKLCLGPKALQVGMSIGCTESLLMRCTKNAGRSDIFVGGEVGR